MDLHPWIVGWSSRREAVLIKRPKFYSQINHSQGAIKGWEEAGLLHSFDEGGYSDTQRAELSGGQLEGDVYNIILDIGGT
ncbi:hypothetical protein AXF42_Ash001715 [Apostasia shenzhenica]|uniref:Uncharacterized protein n=1 Tax=Apostasia shenzhenica TaxID=1088818 RepID=A0A2I0AB19_9ASPA|nr:hypothetical protein AXF42_Ash001715 [Apostasia shenzhenica]